MGFLFLRGVNNSQPNKGVSPEQISIREYAGKIQWQLLNSEWRDITTTASLRGDKGDPGETGQNGADGKNGADGQPGANGAAGLDGRPGSNGKDGVSGTPGLDGIDGKPGADGQPGLDGQNGKQIELQKGTLYIQWRYVGDASWNNLIAYTDLKGDKGDPGPEGPAGPTGSANQLSIGTITTGSPAASITGAMPNQILNLTFPTSPIGGATGQILAKNSNIDYDTKWVDSPERAGTGSPEGVVSATPGTYYTDTSGTNGAWRWIKTSGAGTTGWRVMYGNTGWQRIVISGWNWEIMRSNDTVFLRIDKPVTALNSGAVWRWNPGWRAKDAVSLYWLVPVPYTQTVSASVEGYGSSFGFYYTTNQAQGMISWAVDPSEPWPSSLTNILAS